MGPLAADFGSGQSCHGFEVCNSYDFRDFGFRGWSFCLLQSDRDGGAGEFECSALDGGRGRENRSCRGVRVGTAADVVAGHHREVLEQRGEAAEGFAIGFGPS